jgi:hypothetical protein
VLDHGRVVFDGDPQFATGHAAGAARHGRGHRRTGGGAGAGARVRADHDRGRARAERGRVRRGRPGRDQGRDVGLAGDGAHASRRGGGRHGRRRLPVWVMDADRDQLPAEPGDWTLDFAVAACPPLHGAFQVASGSTTATARRSAWSAAPRPSGSAAGRSPACSPCRTRWHRGDRGGPARPGPVQVGTGRRREGEPGDSAGE